MYYVLMYRVYIGQHFIFSFEPYNVSLGAFTMNVCSFGDKKTRKIQLKIQLDAAYLYKI